MAYSYNIDRLKSDLALRGWLGTDLARAAGVSHTSVHRALGAGTVSPRMMARLARALGYTVRRYVVVGKAA
jgi:hypothetical protein